MTTVLSWLFIALPFVLALLAALAIPLLGGLLYRRVAAGLVFVALMTGGGAFFFGQMRLYLGIHVYVDDLGYALLGAVAALRWALAADMPRRHASWLVWSALFFVALALGLLAHGTTAGVHARDYFYALAAASYFMSFPIGERQLRQLATAMFALALLLLAVAGYRWTVYLLDIRELLPEGGVWSPDGELRVIPAHEALLLAQLLVLSLFFSRWQGAAVRWIAPLLLAAVLAVQHRSVWMATLIGVVVALLAARIAARAAPHARGSTLAQLAALLIVVTLTALPLLFIERLSGLSEQLGRSASTALAGQGTVHSRLQDWRRTLAEWAGAGPQALLVGQGFGRDTTRLLITEDGQRRSVRFGTHNHYVAVLTDTGVIGLAAFGALVAGTLAGLLRLLRQGVEAAAPLLVLLAMQLAYYVPYGTDAWQHVLFGLAVAFVATQRRQAAIDAPRPASPQARIVAWR